MISARERDRAACRRVPDPRSRASATRRTPCPLTSSRASNAGE